MAHRVPSGKSPARRCRKCQKLLFALGESRLLIYGLSGVSIKGMGWLKNRFATLVDALTLRRVIALPLVIAVITALVRLAPVIARAERTPMFLDVPAWTW